MGILDDAIREHLDLKRQHGAPEEELKRQEDEALGPARREMTQPPDGGDGDAAEAEGTLVQEDLSPPADSQAAPDVGYASDEPLTDAIPGARLASEPAEQLEPMTDHPPADPFADDEPFADPAYEGEGEDDHELGGEEGEDAEPDVLEDTPDFLQETPEHDRLWFEQKPPRDFDFD